MAAWEKEFFGVDDSTSQVDTHEEVDLNKLTQEQRLEHEDLMCGSQVYRAIRGRYQTVIVGQHIRTVCCMNQNSLEIHYGACVNIRLRLI